MLIYLFTGIHSFAASMTPRFISECGEYCIKNIFFQTFVWK